MDSTEGIGKIGIGVDIENIDRFKNFKGKNEGKRHRFSCFV